jgi:hypothetical protein
MKELLDCAKKYPPHRNYPQELGTLSDQVVNELLTAQHSKDQLRTLRNKWNKLYHDSASGERYIYRFTHNGKDVVMREVGEAYRKQHILEANTALYYIDALMKKVEANEH